MSRKDTVNTLFMKKLGAPNSNSHAVEKHPDRVRTGAISAMGASLQEMTEGARTAARLQAQLASGLIVVELNPDLIVNSPVSDRILVDVDPNFDALVASIADSGQKVPILVRPDPEMDGRYQIAYGRRRLRASIRLGIPVKAIVQSLSDDELVIAQGKENLDRQDLSFIEKALFARRLEDGGYRRETIIAALSTDKSDLSRYIAVARSVPEDLIQVIGPAPKAGRMRWVALADRIIEDERSIRAALSQIDVSHLTSDERLNKLLQASDPKKPSRALKGQEWKNPKGQKAAKIEHDGRKTKITFDERYVPEFASYLADRLDTLYAEFDKQTRDATPP